MPDSGRPPLFDKAAVRRSFGAAAGDYDEYSVLQREVADRLLGRLDWLKIQPDNILDIGAGTGRPTGALMKRFPKARVHALDLSVPMLGHVKKHGRLFCRPWLICGDGQQLPVANACMDLVFSSLCLQWCDQPDRVFAEIRRVLKPDGVVLFSSFGPDTLKELRASWRAVDELPHVHVFMDMHDIGDLIVRAGLQEPVMSREEITLTYADVFAVMRDLKYIGASNALQSRSRGLMGRGKLRRLVDAYGEWQLPDGQLPATYEVVYGTAWSGQTRRPGMATVAVEEIGRRQVR